MKKPGNRKINDVLQAEQRCILPSSTDVMRGSALGFTDQGPTIEMLANQLAELILEAYIFNKRNTN